MAYRKVYFRIQTYAYGYDSGWSSEADEAAFDNECCGLFQQLGWTLHPVSNGGCDTVTKDRQDLYLHPFNFSGVMDEANIQPLQEQLSKGKTFRCYAVDCYEEYADLSDEEYRAALDAKREEITAFILEQCRTKRTNLYITGSVALHFAKHFEIHCLCDRDGLLVLLQFFPGRCGAARGRTSPLSLPFLPNLLRPRNKSILAFWKTAV